MNDVQSYLWLQKALGAGSLKVPSICEQYGTARAFYEGGPTEWRLSGLVTAAEVHRLQSVKEADCDEVLDACQRLQYHVLTPQMDAYPNRLRNLPDYPAALYVWGDLGDIDDQIGIAVVGTRSASPYGKQVTTHLTATLAKAGAVIISGAAYGIDTYAHQGALMGGGRTIAVLGCGINARYLVENSELRRTISQNGAVVSEYPPGVMPTRVSFPVRNRLIAGLSLGTLVVEAGERSGSLITARLAGEQGKDVFAVPGSILSEYSAGCNRLLADGARPVACAYDIMAEYADQYPHRVKLHVPGVNDPAHSQMKPSPVPAQRKTPAARPVPQKPAEPPVVAAMVRPHPDNLSERAERLLEVLTPAPRHIDELAESAHLPSYEAASAATELEISRLAKSHVGRRFSLL